eukprot:TRINITY_DN3970_c0_g1_i1.p1 TRINITY_DN3970_c0_g1~~TRINITY_DN3970_c0_g1_i1.p1  ORF type:complete len:863 (-),score=173.77 TRINITY_DN3970_c0_g1_i1:25-2613(-)
MINHSTLACEISVSKFVDFEFSELEQHKTLVDRANYEYQATKLRFAKDFKKTTTAEQANQTEKDLDKLKSSLNEKVKHFERALQDLSVRRDSKFLRSLLRNLKTHSLFLRQSLELFGTIENDLDEIESFLDSNTKGLVEGQLTICNRLARRKIWVVIKNSYVYFYLSKREFKPEFTLNLTVCTVRVPADRLKLEIVQAGTSKPFVFLAETETERDHWVRRLQHAISDALNAQQLHVDLDFNTTKSEEEEQFVRSLLWAVPGNTECADCKMKDPEWACINLGVLICMECSGVHRSLGTHITKVRSLTLDKFDSELLFFMQSIGNKRGNAMLEANVSEEEEADRPTERSDRSGRDYWIVQKYKNKKFLSASEPIPILTEKLFRSVGNTEGENEEEKGLTTTLTASTKEAYQLELLLKGADPNWRNPAQNNQTSLHRALLHQDSSKAATVHLLLEFGADVLLPDDTGQSSLHLVAASDDLICCNLLIKRRQLFQSLLTIRDSSGRSPLDVAISSAALRCARLLQGEKLVTSLSDDRKSLVATFATQVFVVAPPDQTVDQEASDVEDNSGSGDEHASDKKVSSPLQGKLPRRLGQRGFSKVLAESFSSILSDTISSSSSSTANDDLFVDPTPKNTLSPARVRSGSERSGTSSLSSSNERLPKWRNKADPLHKYPQLKSNDNLLDPSLFIPTSFEEESSLTSSISALISPSPSPRSSHSLSFSTSHHPPSLASSLKTPISPPTSSINLLSMSDIKESPPFQKDGNRISTSSESFSLGHRRSPSASRVEKLLFRNSGGSPNGSEISPETPTRTTLSLTKTQTGGMVGILDFDEGEADPFNLPSFPSPALKKSGIRLPRFLLKREQQNK